MVCPVDNTTLVITDRQGIEIDYCPQCRGVWLDRGELDKIIERGAAYEARPVSDSRRSYDDDRRHDDRPYEARPADHRDDHRRDDHHGDYRGHQKKHKREGFLGDLFEFGD
jgi:uncharacterized protein